MSRTLFGIALVASAILLWQAVCGEAADRAASKKPTLEAGASPLAIQIKTLLDEGFVFAPGRVQAAQKQFAAARGNAGGDPRLEYAYGLVLLKQSQPGLAKAQFEAAATRTGIVYWPAWQALIRSQLIEKQYDAGLTRLDEFAELVRKSADGNEITRVQSDAARWIGQVIGGLEKTTDKAKVGERLTRSESHIRERLGEELSQELQLGIDSVQKRFDELSEQSELAAESETRKKEQKRTEQAEKIESDLGGIDQEKKTADQTRKELKEKFEEQLTKLDKQLGELERDYGFLQKQAASVEQSYVLVGREITSMQMQAEGVKGRISGPRQEQAIAQRQNQMAMYEQEYAATGMKMGQIVRQANVVLLQRAGVVRQYELSTGELVKKNATLDKWATRANEKKKKLTGAAPAKTKKLASHDAKLHALTTYVPLDLEAEKKDLIESFTSKDSK